MARPDDSRPRRRAWLLAGTTVVAGILACAIGLTAVAVAPRPAATESSGPGQSGPIAAESSGPPSPSSAPAASGDPPAATPAPVPSGPSRSEIRAAAIRGALQRELDAIRLRLGIPGVSVTIVFRDGSEWTGTSGLADVATKVEVTEDTAFAIASVSKTFTAAVVLALADEGRIDLDAAAVTYVPEMPIDGRITVRQLLDHTSGLDDYFLHPPIDKALLADRTAFWSVRRTLKYVGRPYFAPGTGWHYSNTNYLYLGLIAERVSGQTLSVALRERFFDPLDLEETWYQAVEKPRVSLATGYRFATARLTDRPISLADGTGVAPFTSVVSAAGGAGSIASSSPDLARWARLLYKGDVLGQAMTEEMIDGVEVTAGYRPRVPYGLGVQAFLIDGRPTLGHSGRLLGFRSVVRHVPSESLTIAVLTNQSRADPALIVDALLDIVFRPDGPCRACQQVR